MTRLPADPDTLFAALLARDPSYEGLALVGVRTTGIYCRLTCPARKPLARNCAWFSDAAAAQAAGFRPCRRCHPPSGPDPEVATPPVVAALLAQLRADPARRWTQADLIAQGLDTSTVRRAFQRHLGQSFLSLARAQRLREGMQRLQDQSGRMIDAQLDAGYDSASGFRRAFRRLFGHAPHQMTGRADLRATWIETPLGGMIAIADDAALCLLEFTDRKALPQGLRRLSERVGGRIGLGRTEITDATETALADWFGGRSAGLDLPLRLIGTPFQIRVWQALRAIPPGTTISYAQLALAIGQPRATRAVAAANGANRLALVVPCHRVIGADGGLGGYAGGLWRKEKLIQIERAAARQAETTGNRARPTLGT